MVIIEDTRNKVGKHDLKNEWFGANGIKVVRSKLPFGDYALMPKVAVDTKQGLDEVAMNLCGSSHNRFKEECIGARDSGCKLYILVENTYGIKSIGDVASWINPRVIYSEKCVQGVQLMKAMVTMQERYGIEFIFCNPNDTASKIVELLRGDSSG